MNDLLNILRIKAKELKGQPEIVKIYKCMIVITTGMDEHPDNWNEPCNCNLCRSYGDSE